MVGKTTVFLGILYPQNVQRKCPKGTDHRGKINNAQTTEKLENEHLRSTVDHLSYTRKDSFQHVEFK